MSTPEPPLPAAPTGTPAEASQAARLGPTGTSPQVTAAPLPTPGVSPAAARAPGPTGLDWDPAGLLGLVSRLANDLFAAPPDAGAQEIAAPAVPAVPATSAPPVAAPAAPSVAAPAGQPITAPLGGGANPFSAPLRFDAVELHGVPLFTVPLFEGPAAPPPPEAPAPSLSEARAPAAPTPVAPAAPSPALAPAAPVAPAPSLAPAAPAAPPFPSPPPEELPAAPPADAAAPSLSLIELAAPPPLSPGPAAPFDPHALRREFPILQQRVHGRPLVWLDNAATTQKPRAVIDRLSAFYERENSNVHRAAHTIAARATDAYESARGTARRFLNASSVSEIIFVRGATEGINLIAQSWGRRHVGKGDEIVVTHLEHHANIVPWQLLCAERGARLRVAPVDDRGQVILEEYERLLGPRTRLVSLTQVSNALGTVTPAREMVALAQRHGARVLVDGAQAVSHMSVDVQQLGCDFYVFSGHKVFAPTGIGVVFGRQAVLDEMPPWQGGGNMIQDVTFERTTYQPAPARFEAGTGNIADAVGLGAALEWLLRLGLPSVSRHEHELLEYATGCLATVPGLRLIGTAPDKAGVLSFVLGGQRTEEVGGLLDQEGIAVRSGHHCAQPILRRFGLEATVRASLAPYNTREDIDALTAALRRLQAGRAII